MLTIFRGDDLAFANDDRKVCVRFTTTLDLTGWAASFSLLDNIKSTNDISSKMWTFGYDAEETSKFPLGKTLGILTLYDSTGQVRQMASVEVDIVCIKPEPVFHGCISISIDNLIANYDSLANKPTLNGVEIEGDHDSEYYHIDASGGEIEALKKRMDDVEQDIEILTPIVNETADKVDGFLPIDELMFDAEVPGTPSQEKAYTVKVVMRDDGAGKGHLLPTFAFFEVDGDESDSDASDASDTSDASDASE